MGDVGTKSIRAPLLEELQREGGAVFLLGLVSCLIPSKLSAGLPQPRPPHEGDILSPVDLGDLLIMIFAVNLETLETMTRLQE